MTTKQVKAKRKALLKKSEFYGVEFLRLHKRAYEMLNKSRNLYDQAQQMVSAKLERRARVK